MKKSKTQTKVKTEPKKLRIMINSNAIWSVSGYGSQIAQFVPKMVKEGYEVACVNFYGLEGGSFTKDGIVHYPKIGSQWGEDAMVEHGKIFKPDVMFTLQDIWTMNPQLLQQFTRFIPIIPIDHEPTPPAILERLKMAYRIVTISEFGHDQLKNEGLHSMYIPHTVDTNIFKKMDNKEVRKSIGIPEDTFLFGMVAANKDNPPRKSFQEVLDAFKRFQEKHDNSMIYFHTLLKQSGGFDIEEYAKYLGIGHKVAFTQPYDMLFRMTPSDMAKLYSTFDCLLCPSTNEGFGVPQIEAMACEVPVITTDFTAMRTVIVDNVTGYKTKVAYKRFTPLHAFIGVPDVDDLYKNMEKIYEVDRVEMGKKAREHVLKNYDLDIVYEKTWSPFLRLLEKEIYR